MAGQTVDSEYAIPPEPELRRHDAEPRGVIRKNLKILLFLAASAVVVIAALVSTSGRKSPSQSSAAQHEPPQPAIQDSTDNNVQDLKNQLAIERQKEAQAAAATTLPNGTLAQQTAAAAYGPTGQSAVCTPGQPCAQQQSASMQQLSPAQQQAEELAAKERELGYNARFASNLVYARTADPQSGSFSQPIAHDDASAPSTPNQIAAGPASNLVPTAQDSEQKNNSTDHSSAKPNTEVNIDSAEGQPYVVYEGADHGYDSYESTRRRRSWSGEGSGVEPGNMCLSRKEPSCWVRRARSALADSASNAAWRSSSTG